MRIYSCRKLQFLALEHLCNIKVEKVTIEERLHAAGHDRNDVVETFEVISVNPVENIKGAVHAESEQVVRCDGFCFTSFCHHEQLRQDGKRLEVNREGPQDFHDAKLMIKNEREDGRREKNKLDPEGVMIVVVGGLELEEH